jgi:hypothetical protein
MPTHDDEGFERYLKQFRPLTPEVLHTQKPERTRLRLSAFAASASAVMVILIAAVLLMRRGSDETPSPKGARSLAGVGQLGNPQPLTLGGVNALLARAPSAKAAIDQLAHRPRGRQLAAEGAQSALAVLSKEDTQL